MNRVTGLGVLLAEGGVRVSRRGTPYTLGSLAFRGAGRYAQLPLVGYGKLAERVAELDGKPVVLAGYLYEQLVGEERRMRAVVEEVFQVQAPVFEAPLGHLCVDGYARAEVSGLLATPPRPLRGAVGLRVAVRYPLGRADGETFVQGVVPGQEELLRLQPGSRVFLAGSLLPKKGSHNLLEMYVSEARCA